ncbi:mRNA export factor Gle1-like, partial [Bolinopsis microptera]|uniref:mRNA export factor Gle1-like n=1 Tax=Bolinopsis microptera TaxID=2820187 RepID=UPI00307A128C
MPSSPTKSQRSVLFKVTVPSRIENIYQTSEKTKQITTDQQEPGGVRSSKRCITKTTKEADNSSDNAMYHELRKSDLRYKIQSKHRSDRTIQAVETICEFGNMKSDIKAAPNVLESLRNSSHGRVPYNRKHVLSEEELPPVNQLSSVNKKAIDRVCDQSPDIHAYRSKTRGRVPLRSPKETEEIIETTSYLDQSFETNLNKSLAVIESLESLNDSMSLLEIEQKNKKAGVDYIEREKKKQDEFFKRSAQLSQESYEQWSERSRAKIQQQVKELRDRKSQKDNSIESEYRKQQEFFQKKFEEDQANIKRVEVEEEAENQRQLSSSWNNISNYELSTLEIVTVAQKCVPDPKVDPEIEALLSMIDKQSKAMSALKLAVGQLYKEGKLNPLTSTKFEQECGAVYGHVINAVKQLNTAIKRVNEEQAAKMLAQEEAKKKEEEERGKQAQAAAAQQPPPEAVVAQQPLASQQPLPPPVATQQQPSAGPVQSKVSTDSIISGNIISSTAFSEYQKIDKQLKELELGIQKFVVDKNTDCAKMRSALKLITVTPINSISASSNDHMANKVKELVHILDGKETTRGQKRINPGINNLTLNYCFNVAASKFVDQACEQVAFSDNLVPAFSIAAVST